MKASTFTFLAIVMMGCVVPASESAPLKQYFGKSYALVIGIDQYDAPGWAPLKYAVKDAEAMVAYLKRQGFEVQALYNKQATRQAILGHLIDVLSPKITRDDRVLVFFAGHGGTDVRAGRSHGYIVPADGGRGFSSNIQMDELRTAALMMDEARHQLFIMDACYGGLLAATRGSKVSEDHPAYLDEITGRKARQVLTAGGADQQVADGGPGGHSHFTFHLLQALEKAGGDLNGDGYITFAELAAYIVSVAHSFQQTPTYSTLAGHGLGEFVFLSPKPAVSQERPLPVTTSQRRGSAPTVTEEVLTLVHDFFTANNNEDVEAFVQMFTTTPSYFSWGPTPHDKIRKDKQYFFNRWPDVEYTPIGEPKVISTGSNRFQVDIKFDFYVRNMKRCEGKHGESSFELGVENVHGKWKISSIKEDVYYRDKPFTPC
jgi:hypothetical protein